MLRIFSTMDGFRSLYIACNVSGTVSSGVRRMLSKLIASSLGLLRLAWEATSNRDHSDLFLDRLWT